MSNYTLCYFDFPGLAEPIRYFFAYAEQDFEDFRMDPETSSSETEDTPFWKQLPSLLIDNEMYTQSVAICRFLAEEFGLSGKNDLENLELDSLIEDIAFLNENCMTFQYTTDLKQEVNENLKNLLPFLDRLEKLIEENNGYVAFGRLTWVDIYLAASLPFMSECSEIDLLKGRPNLGKLIEKIISLPGIQKYLYITREHSHEIKKIKLN